MRKALFFITVSTLVAAAACSGSSSDGATGDDDVQPGTDASTGGGDSSVTDAGSTPDAHVIVDAGFVPILDAAAASTRFKAVSKDETTAPNGFYQYLPPGYDGSLAAPLLVFWHGLGEDGDGLAEPDGGGTLYKVPANGPPRLIKADQWPNARPFIVLSPQHGPNDCPSNDEIDAFMTWAIGHYTVDDKRIYLTGLSCGAIGSWSYVTKYKDKVVAASLLISGDPGGAYTTDGCSLVKNMALWSVHGSADPQVSPYNDETQMPEFIACAEPRADVKFNLIDGGQHDVWTKTYDLSYGIGDVYQWMLDNHKP